MFQELPMSKPGGHNQEVAAGAGQEVRWREESRSSKALYLLAFIRGRCRPGLRLRAPLLKLPRVRRGCNTAIYNFSFLSHTKLFSFKVAGHTPAIK